MYVSMVSLMSGRVRAGSATLNQVRYGLMDLSLHAFYVPAPGTSVWNSSTYKNVLAKTTTLTDVPQDR